MDGGVANAHASAGINADVPQGGLRATSREAWGAAPEEARSPRSPRSPKYRGGELPPEEELAREEEERLRSRAEQQLQVELQSLREREREYEALLPKVIFIYLPIHVVRILLTIWLAPPNIFDPLSKLHTAEHEIAALVKTHAETEARLAEQKQMATQSANDITAYTQQNARSGREETKRQARIADLEKKIRHARVTASERECVGHRA